MFFKKDVPVHYVPRHLLSRGATESRGIRMNSEAEKPATEDAGHCIFESTQPRGGTMYARRKGEHGSAILESFLSMILLGMILCSAIVLLRDYFDDVIHDEDYLLETYDAPMLATIPDLLAKTPKKYGYYGSSSQGKKGGAK